MAEKVEQPPDGQVPAKAETNKKAKKAKLPKQQKKSKQDDGMYLPVLVEFTFTSSVIFLVLVFLAMAAVSWLTGTSLLDFVMRTSAAIGLLGGLLMIVTRQVSTGVLEASRDEIEKKLQESLAEEASELEVHNNSDQREQTENAEAADDFEHPVNAEAH